MSEKASDVGAEVASLRAMTETELKGLNARMGKVEKTQAALVNVATQGKTGLRVFLWLGGFLGGGVAVAVAIWDRISG